MRFHIRDGVHPWQLTSWMAIALLICACAEGGVQEGTVTEESSLSTDGFSTGDTGGAADSVGQSKQPGKQLVIPPNAHVLVGGEIPPALRAERARSTEELQPSMERSPRIPDWRAPENDSDRAQRNAATAKEVFGGPAAIDSITLRQHPELSAKWRKRPPGLPLKPPSKSRLKAAQDAYKSWVAANPGASKRAQQSEAARLYRQQRRTP